MAKHGKGRAAMRGNGAGQAGDWNQLWPPAREGPRVQALDGSTQTSKGRSFKKEITREGPNKLLTLEPRPEMDILDQQLSKMS